MFIREEVRFCLSPCFTLPKERKGLQLQQTFLHCLGTSDIYNERVIVSSVIYTGVPNLRAINSRVPRVSASDVQLIRTRSRADKPRFRLILALLPEIPRDETMRAPMYI